MFVKFCDTNGLYYYSKTSTATTYIMIPTGNRFFLVNLPHHHVSAWC